jgi:hypothetical protein
MGRENACHHTEDPPVVIQTLYLSDLDPLDASLRHLFRYLFNQTQKDPESGEKSGSISMVCPLDIRVIRKSLTRKVVPDVSDEHIS